jgi:DNA-binding winged helix-turn-helix (wHTH) protein/tetratricopeptide (TPR) repeat protein
MKVFHPFRLDTVNHCLWRGEKRMELAPRAFDVLRYLVEHSDRLVTQDEILEALWPGTYVNSEVVKKYVLGIRKVLGDQHQSPTFVATFPKRGYQFIAAVRDESGALTEVSANTPKAIVGRGDALAQLDECLDKALGCQRGVIFITGEAGIGKTSLLDVFQHRAMSRPNLRIARGQCVEGFGGKEAYYPVLEALGQWLRMEGGGPVVHTLAKQAPTWLIQFPSLVKADQRTALQKEILGATRERMVREICEALESLAAQDALVLILEDLHWVDPSTLDFISALARRRGPAKLLLLGSYRPADAIISQSPLRTLKQDLVLHSLSCEISLERLERPDVAEYLAIQFAEGALTTEFADLIHRHSGGNALFMVTILQDLVKKGVITGEVGGWALRGAVECVELGVPETLDQLIELQFKQLTSVEQCILRSASVMGERFSVWSISNTLDVQSEQIENLCEGLAERHQFITRTGTDELTRGDFSAHYEFKHSLYRQVLYRRLSDANRSKLHRGIAESVKSLCIAGKRELASELALHLEGAREYEQAIRYLILAAENAAGRFAYRESIGILDHALELVAKISSPLQPDPRIRIYDFIGYAHFAAGAFADSAQAYEAAAGWAQEAGLKTAQVESLTSAMFPLGFISPDRGLAALDQAVQMSVSAGDPVLVARTQKVAAGCHLIFDSWSKDYADICASAHETLRRLGDTEEIPFQQMTYGHVLALQGRYREAMALMDATDAAIFRSDYSTSLIPHVGAISGRTLILLRTGRLGDVLRITRHGKESTDENMGRSWLLAFREAWLRMLVFDYEGAHRISTAIAKTRGDDQHGQPHTIMQLAAGYMALNRGEYRQAIEYFEHVHRPAAATKFFLHWVWRMTAQLESGNACLQCGDILKARSVAEDYLQSALSTADPHLRALGWDLMARVAMAEKDFAGAHDHIGHAVAILEQSEIPIAAWQTYATAWRLYASAKEQKVAEAYRERAESCILKITDSFEADEPLRSSFLSAAPVFRILRRKAVVSAVRLSKPRHSA